ncbi:MAG: hypothetical protein MJ172_04130 [Clostridia bacterium]|nr:hypothetical protein [Clostridia bacterium]
MSKANNDNMNRFYEKSGEANGLDFSTNMDKYIKHIETLETLNHALWLLLEEHGATHEELNEKIAIILEQKKMQNGKLELECSNCHQKMQMSGAFKCKCIYCGAEFVSNPYQIKFNQNNVPEVIDAVSEEVVEESPIESGTAFEPYDVSKDLGFDTEE